MNQLKESRQQERKHSEGENPVAPAPAPLEVSGGTGEVGEHVQIGEVDPDDQCSGAECGSSAQSAAGEGDPDERMADRIYSSLASMSI